MLFNSLHFAYFFPIALFLFFLTHGSTRYLIIFILSCYFYMVFRPVYILTIFLLVFVDYYAGILIEKNAGLKRRIYLVLSIIANVSVLSIFKYFNFFVENVSTMLHAFSIPAYLPFLHLALPIGLSFHTFQSLGYTIEVYRGHQKAQKNLLSYAVYVLYWPQLVAGPIERPQNLIPQFLKNHTFNNKRAIEGFHLMLVGFLKKIVIADRLAIYVNAVYGHPRQYQGFPLIITTYFFAFQIYCDFSGYTDIARGASRIMGIELMNNFERPYCSISIRQFWKRWHISLSTWFKDYLYFPLGGNRCPWPRKIFNLMVVFLISGFWHGANWTFVAWGLLHGLYQIIFLWLAWCYRKFYNYVPRFMKNHSLQTILGGLITFHLVTIAWVFFRAKNVDDAFYILDNMFKIPPLALALSTLWAVISRGELLLCFLLLSTLFTCEILIERFRWTNILSRLPRGIRWGFYLVSLYLIIFFGKFKVTPFIYFQF